MKAGRQRDRRGQLPLARVDVLLIADNHIARWHKVGIDQNMHVPALVNLPRTLHSQAGRRGLDLKRGWHQLHRLVVQQKLTGGLRPVRPRDRDHHDIAARPGAIWAPSRIANADMDAGRQRDRRSQLPLPEVNMVRVADNHIARRHKIGIHQNMHVPSVGVNHPTHSTVKPVTRS